MEHRYRTHYRIASVLIRSDQLHANRQCVRGQLRTIQSLVGPSLLINTVLILSDGRNNQSLVFALSGPMASRQ